MMVTSGRRRRDDDGLPLSVTVLVVVVLLGLLVWNVTTQGAEGYPTTVVIAGLLGAYGGLRELVARKRRGDE